MLYHLSFAKIGKGNQEYDSRCLSPSPRFKSIVHNNFENFSPKTAEIKIFLKIFALYSNANVSIVLCRQLPQIKPLRYNKKNAEVQNVSRSTKRKPKKKRNGTKNAPFQVRYSIRPHPKAERTACSRFYENARSLPLRGRDSSKNTNTGSPCT